MKKNKSPNYDLESDAGSPNEPTPTQSAVKLLLSEDIDEKVLD
jgi:hypothetical protein